MHHATSKTLRRRWLGKVLDEWLNYYAVPNSYRYHDRFATLPEGVCGCSKSTPTVAEGPHEMGRYCGSDR